MCTYIFIHILIRVFTFYNFNGDLYFYSYINTRLHRPSSCLFTISMRIYISTYILIHEPIFFYKFLWDLYFNSYINTGVYFLWHIHKKFPILKFRNSITTRSMLFIYEQIVTDKYYNYNCHTWDNNLALTSNFITGLISHYTIFNQ
jgi:hypothetical protein